MMLWGFTLEQIRAATKLQIINWVTTKLNGMTKRQIIELLLDIYSVSRPPVVVLGPDGQVARMETVEEDVTGVKIGSTLITHTYYPGGEVDEISVANRDAADAPVGGYVVKHWTDGKRPVKLALDGAELVGEQEAELSFDTPA